MKYKISGLLFWSAWGLLIAVLFATDAKAWGPGAHIECSTYLLNSLALLAPAIRALIKKHPNAFTYGSLCPDMVLGKRYLPRECNNHHWEIGFNLLNQAPADRERAFALGYLSHLAADTVAHNDFIPDQLLDRFGHRRRGHVMFELIFDVAMGDEVWRTARTLSRGNFGECERLMLKHIPRTPVPQKVNQRVFRSGALLIRVGGWEQIVKQIRPRLARELSQETIAPYLDAVHRSALDVLNNGEAASCLQRSPTGGDILPAAEDLRKALRHLSRKNELDVAGSSRLIAAFKDWRGQAIFPEPCEFSQ